jgi:HK97 family phage prohead protease
MEIERRALSAPLEVRADGQTVAGYAAVFNSETDIGGMFREKIAPGAFKPSLNGDVRALWNHVSSNVIGRTKAGTLRLAEDNKGLAVEIDLPDTQVGRDLRENMRLGNVDGMSFGFRVTKQQWDETGDIPVRTIEEVELFEVSAVTFPAYEATEIALRSLDKQRDEREKKEHNAAAAKARIAARRAAAEQKFRGIKPE